MNSFISVQVHYGLSVPAFDLLAAIRAYTQIEGAFRATELISRHRRKGTLKTLEGAAGAVGRVPDEVWDMIRQEMVATGVGEARLKLMGELGCSNCLEDEVRGAMPPFSPQPEEELSVHTVANDLIEAEEWVGLNEALERDLLRAREEDYAQHVHDSAWYDHPRLKQCHHPYTPVCAFLKDLTGKVPLFLFWG